MSKVSVVIPTYNSVQYVSLAVESVLTQTFRDYELIVVDDGSTDDTRQVLSQYENKLTYIYQENQERAVARNTGIRASSGQYLAFLDADDVWLPEKLERQVAVIEQYPEVALVYCQAAYIDPAGGPVKFKGNWTNGHPEQRTVIADRSKELLMGDVVYGGGSSPLVRRSLLEEVGYFDEALNYPEDWDLWIRLSRKGLFAYIPEPLLRYRVYGWERVLGFNASERIVAQHLRVVEKAMAGWNSSQPERERLYRQAVAVIYKRAALAAYQLERIEQGQDYLKKAVAADPKLLSKGGILHLAVDRAKLIETETGSYLQSEAFIHTFFSNLPERVRHHQTSAKVALGWLYIGGAFEQHRQGNKAAVRSLLKNGLVYAPAGIKNRGVVSIAIQAWMGNALTSWFRRVGKKISQMKNIGNQANA